MNKRMNFFTDRTLIQLVLVAILVLSILEQTQDPASKKYTVTILILSVIAVAMSTYYYAQQIITQGLLSSGPSAVVDAVNSASKTINYRTDLARQGIIQKSFAARQRF